MPTECSAEQFDFGMVEGRAVEAAFDAGLVTSDAGGLLLGATDRAIDLVDRFAACFRDHRRQDLIEHAVATLIGQRVFGIALGYEDLNDHDQLRHDPVMAVLAGKLSSTRETCAPVAGKSTLNRLELSREEPTRYHKIAYDEAAIEALPVTLFLEAHKRPPKQIILDLDATDDPLHGHQEGRFFHGYYDCYCYLPLYVFCGRHLLAGQAAALRHRRQRGQRRGDRADRPADPRPLAVCAHPAAGGLWLCARGADGVVRTKPCGLCVRARPQRPPGRHDRTGACRGPGDGREERTTGAPLQGLPVEHARQLEPPAPRHRQGGVDAGRGQSALPRHLAQAREAGARQLYEDIYCARGDMENRIKECQLDLYADRTSAATMRANQLRLWFASMAYVLICALRRIGLAETIFADATCGTIRLKFLKIGALVRISVRRIKLAMASACPAADEWGRAARRLADAAKARAAPT